MAQKRNADKKVQKSCGCECKSSCCAGQQAKPKTPVLCPVCAEKGHPVSYETARGILKKNVKIGIGGNYFLCANPVCEVSYFSKNAFWTLKDCKVEFDFKNKAEKRYACYCNKLTYEEVAEVIRETGNSSWSFVVKKAKGKLNPCRCLTENPFGRCCSSNSFKKAVLQNWGNTAED